MTSFYVPSNLRRELVYYYFWYIKRRTCEKYWWNYHNDFFSIIISSCSSLPKPNLNEPDSILIVPVSVINKSKFPISLQLLFTFHKVDDGSKVFHTYKPKVGDSYLILKHLKPGNYKFKRVSQSKKTKIGKNIYSNDFIMADNTITIIQDKFNYTQSE